jgi:hypothetical protein
VRFRNESEKREEEERETRTGDVKVVALDSDTNGSLITPGGLPLLEAEEE